MITHATNLDIYKHVTMTNCQINVQFVLILFSFVLLCNVVLSERKLKSKSLTNPNIVNNAATTNNQQAKPSNGLKTSNRIRKRDVDFETNEEEISADASQGNFENLKCVTWKKSR